MLEVDVRKGLGGFAVDARFSADAGVTALFGRSGAGKTSIVQMLAGLRAPDSGRIALDGTVLFDSDRRVDVRPERRHIGYIFQDARLFPHMTVRRNLEFGRRRRRGAAPAATPGPVVEVLGIGHLLERGVHDLSGGERQRVAIGRALLASPRLLLMDEPLASLDSERKREIIPFIERVQRQFAIPTIYVSHAMEEILELAANVVLVDDGRVVAAGPVEEVMSGIELARVVEPGDAGTVVAAEVADGDDGHGLAALTFAGGVFRVPASGLVPGARVRIRVRARDVSLALERPAGVSVLNIFSGRVVRIVPTGDAQADVLVDAGGARLWSRVTARSVHDLALAPGKPVHAMVKAVAVDRPGTRAQG